MDKLLDWAKYYLSKNINVIPLKPKDKKPAIDSWLPYQNRRPTEDEINEWFGNGSENNIGIVTGAISGVTVIDLDSQEAVEFAKRENFPKTPLAKTGKGYHAYYRYKNGVRNFQKRDDLPGIDLRSEGGYVVAPPSIHSSGHQYQWVKGKNLDDLPFADLPEIILTQKPEDKTPLRKLYAGASEGERNDSLTRLVGSWVNDKLTFEECLENAYLWNSKNPSPLPEREVGRTVKSIFEKHHRDKQTDTKEEPEVTLHKENNNPYFVDDSGYLCRWKQTKDGHVPIRLANFKAEIAAENIEDDGLELIHNYLIEGKIGGKLLPIIEIPASSFGSMNWLHKWGNQTILEPGQATKDYVRHAIQINSNGAKKHILFIHTGWRKIQNEWVYLTGNGAIGKDDVSVKLPKELQRYGLPLTPENEIEGIKTSLSFLDIGKREITLPLLSIVFLSPLTTILEPMPNFSGYLYGETGVLKTTIAILLLSHYGSFDSVNSLSNFDDTANAIEKRAFTLKDTLHIIDDFHPSIKRIDAQHKESLAQRIIRAYSNRTARGRLNPDTSEKGRFEPRGMLLMTGEEIVSLQSTLARLTVFEISNTDIDKGKLTELQLKAHLLPHAMSSYISWLREHMQEIKETFPKQFIRLRDRAFKEDTHKKLPEQVAFLQFALDTAISWLVDKNVLNENEAVSLSKEGWDIFLKLADNQSQRLEREDPIKRFEEILQTLIAQGKVRIEDKDIPNKIMGNLQGDLIGYYDDLYLYLLPPALWHSLQRFCIAEGSHFPFSKNTFYRMLRNRKLIETRDNSNTINQKIRGNQHKVLKFIGGGICLKEVTEVTDDVEA